MFTVDHQRFWENARRRLGDGPGTRALIGVLLLHRIMPAEAVIAGMQAALSWTAATLTWPRWRPAAPTIASHRRR
jgi:hypothetical protein